MPYRFRLACWVSIALMSWTAARAEPPIAQLSWLSGCWASDGGEAGSGEQWMTPAGGTVFGVSRTVKHGKTVQYEFLQIREENGKMVLIATPSGQAIATFALLKMTSTEIVFENLQHDFPQRVAYRLASPSRLIGRIEGMRKGKLSVIEYPLSKVECAT
jgi:hypothetical protein